QEYVLCVLNVRSGGAESPDIQARVDQCAEIMSALRDPPRQPYLIVLWALSSGPPADLEINEEQRRRVLSSDPWFAALGHFSDGYFRLFVGKVAEADPEFVPSLETFRA